MSTHNENLKLKSLLAGMLAAGGIALAAPALADDDDKNVLEEAGEYVSDAAVTTKVNAAFVESEALSALDIDVETTNGVVTLSGDVDSEDQIDLAEDIAEHVEGVEDVHNELRVSGMGDS